MYQLHYRRSAPTVRQSRMFGLNAVALIFTLMFGCFLLPVSCFAQVILPFDILPYQHVDTVVNLFKAKAIDAGIVRNQEGGQEVRATKVEWKDIEFDTVIVSFTGQPEEVTQISLVRACEEDEVEKATEKLITDISELFGAPTEDAMDYAIWSRGIRQMIFLGRREDNQSIAASFDVEAALYRRPSTDAYWPYQIPIDASRDEIERIVTAACSRLIERDDMFISTAGCFWLGIRSRKMIIWNDEGGLITQIEARFDPARESEVRDAIVKKYGKQTASDDTGSSWHFVGSSDAVRLEKQDADLVVLIDVLALERKQYAE